MKNEVRWMDIPESLVRSYFDLYRSTHFKLNISFRFETMLSLCTVLHPDRFRYPRLKHEKARLTWTRIWRAAWFQILFKKKLFPELHNFFFQKKKVNFYGSSIWVSFFGKVIHHSSPNVRLFFILKEISLFISKKKEVLWRKRKSFIH